MVDRIFRSTMAPLAHKNPIIVINGSPDFTGLNTYESGMEYAWGCMEVCYDVQPWATTLWLGGFRLARLHPTDLHRANRLFTTNVVMYFTVTFLTLIRPRRLLL